MPEPDDWAERMAGAEPLYILLTYDETVEGWSTDTNAADQESFIDGLLSVLESFATGRNTWEKP